MTYLPFLDGNYSTAPGLNAMAKASPADQFVFQLDDQYAMFIDNIRRCRAEDIHKYYWQKDLSPETAVGVNRLMVDRLVAEYPADFVLVGECALENRRTGERLEWARDWLTMAGGEYISLFDALCSQVQEDVAICQLEEERDWLAAIHLSAPNHWDPAEKVGRPFSSVHAVVPGMEKLNQNYFKMLVTAVQKGPFFRFAWGIATDDRLNHHPVPPPGVDAGHWQGRRVAEDVDAIYVRVERQTITGLPECNAFLFTIRTYFYAIDGFSADEKRALLQAVEGMSPASLEYKGLTGAVGVLRKRLSP
jgi:hypothetical protein